MASKKASIAIDGTSTSTATSSSSTSVSVAAALASESKVVSLYTTTNYVDSVALHPTHNDLLAVGTSSLTGDHWNGEVVFMSLANHAPVHRISSYGGISSVAWAATDNKSLLLAAGDEAITYIWACTTDTTPIATPSQSSTSAASSTDEVAKKAAAKKGKGRAPSAAGNDDSKVAASPSSSSVVSSVDTKVVATLHEHCDVISSIAVNSNRASNLVATASYDRTVRVWDLSSPASSLATFNHEDQVLSSSWQPSSSNIIATGTRDGRTQLWDSRAPLSLSLSLPSSDTAITALSWMDASNDTICIGNESGQIRLIDIRAVDRVISTNCHHRAAIRSLAWNGPLLSSSSDDTTVRIFTSSLLTPCDVIIGHTDYVRSAAWYTPSLSSTTTTGVTAAATRVPHLITAGWDKSVRVYTPRTVAL